jgi:hypothetical protein
MIDYMKIYMLLLAACLMAGCSKELNQRPISSATSLTFYATSADFVQGVTAIYASLKTYPDRLINLSETRSDNLYAVSVGGVRDWEGVNSFHKTLSSNPYISEAWNTNFNGIYRANVLLEQLTRNGQVVTTPELRARLEGEARFLRAFFYFDLVRLFGKLPVSDHPLTAAEAATLPRSPVSNAYDLIISDLVFASNNLAASYSGADRGRATRWAAKSLLALVYMTRSGPTYDVEGPGMGLNEWNLALPLLNEVLAAPGFVFSPSYNTIFSYTNENNPEVIFDIQYTTGLTPVIGASFMGLLVPDSYFQSLGVVVGGTSNLRPVSDDLVALYETGDTRKDFTIKKGYVFNGEPENRPFFRKYLDETKIPKNIQDWPINFIAMRYTDVLLLKAECVLHGAPGSTATDVDAAVTKVRQRAGINTPAINITLPQLMDERRKEFASEGLRWHDLVRSGLVTTVMPAWIDATDVQDRIQPFQKEYIVYPIPQAELDVKVGLYEQNKGY